MNQNFVKVSNNFIESKEYINYKTGEKIYNKYHLSPDELYLYFFLNMIRNFKTIKTTLVSIDLLNQLIRFQGRKKYNLSDKRNKIKIWELLQSLKAKKVINFNIEDLSKEKNNTKLYYTLLEISFIDIKEEFEKIYYYNFDKVNTSEEFYILCISIKERKKRISYIELADRLDCSERYIKNLIKNMTQKDKILNMISGTYIEGTNKQEMNRYYPADEKIDYFIENRNHHWYDFKEKLTYDDYRIFKTTEDKNLIIQANKRIKAITKVKPDFFISWEKRFNKESEKDEIFESPKVLDNDTSNKEFLELLKDEEEISNSERIYNEIMNNVPEEKLKPVDINLFLEFHKITLKEYKNDFLQELLKDEYVKEYGATDFKELDTLVS